MFFDAGFIFFSTKYLQESEKSLIFGASFTGIFGRSAE